MNILDEIIEYKKKFLKGKKETTGFKKLESSAYFKKECKSLTKMLKEEKRTGIIAEFKRKSPSKGIINDRTDIKDVVKAYEENGASGISVLTDEKYFAGKNEDIIATRKIIDIPLLRKDFIIDEYQVIEAKSIGADVILLIAACLSPKEVKGLARTAKNIGLEVLLELHDEKEINHIYDETDLIGINNRNLKTFEVDIERSLRMAEMIPGDKIKIAESGINSIESIKLFRENGFKGFLMGEHFMKENDPAKAFQEFTTELKFI